MTALTINHAAAGTFEPFARWIEDNARRFETLPVARQWQRDNPGLPSRLFVMISGEGGVVFEAEVPDHLAHHLTPMEERKTP